LRFIGHIVGAYYTGVDKMMIEDIRKLRRSRRAAAADQNWPAPPPTQ